MARYVKRHPDTIEAIQWFKYGDHPEVIKLTIKSKVGCLRTCFGDKIVEPNDYIIKYDNGEYDVQSQKEFESTFEKQC